jgi:hypothetical protein
LLVGVFMVGFFFFFGRLFAFETNTINMVICTLYFDL